MHLWIHMLPQVIKSVHILKPSPDRYLGRRLSLVQPHDQTHIAHYLLIHFQSWAILGGVHVET